jgi:acyl-CoA hydrolase
MVAVDEHGQKKNIAALDLRTADQQRRSRQSVLRRKLRKELEERFASATEG